MNEIQIFNNPLFGDIRTATSESGEPLFVANDVCNALGYSNSRDAINRHVDTEDVAKHDTPTKGGIQSLSYINESGVYSLVFGSKLETAKAFKKWVTSEVLPTIRKHGAYMTQSTIEKVLTDPDTLIQLAQTLKEERRQKELAQKQLEYQAPIVQYANEVLSSSSGHTATTIASELNMSAITLNELLVKARFIRRTGKKGEYSLCAPHQGKGYVVTTTFKYEGRDGGSRSKIDLHYTEMGRMKIREIFNRAKNANVLVERKGRYFINYDWRESEKTA